MTVFVVHMTNMQEHKHKSRYSRWKKRNADLWPWITARKRSIKTWCLMCSRSTVPALAFCRWKDVKDFSTHGLRIYYTATHSGTAGGRARGEGAEIKQKKRRYCQEDEMEKRKECTVVKRMVWIEMKGSAEQKKALSQVTYLLPCRPRPFNFCALHRRWHSGSR